MIHKLSLDEFDEVNYELVAIHTSLEDYHLAYFINQQLPILLKKDASDIQVTNKEGETYFSRFTYDEPENETVWSLIQNKNEVSVQNGLNAQNLFGDVTQQISARAYLLPEFKKVDYFLKIENNTGNFEEIISSLNSIEKISTIYTVDTTKIKSKNNLIF